MPTANKYATDGKLGVNLTRVDDPTLNPPMNAPAFPLGTEVTAGDGSHWVYVQLPAIVQAGSFVVLDAANVATLLTTANSPRGNRVACAPAVASAGNYGWVQLSGLIDNAYVGANCLANAQLNTTATGGMVDDDATVGSKVISNLALTTARGGTNGVAPGESSTFMSILNTL